MANQSGVILNGSGASALGVPTPVSFGVEPEQGAVMMPFLLNFTGAVTSISKDLVQEQQQRLIDIVQSIFIDNTGNNSAVIISFNGMYNPSVSGGSRAFLPVLTPKGPLRFTAACNGGNPVPIILLNFRLPYLVW
jgi:hypothetical protein